LKVVQEIFVKEAAKVFGLHKGSDCRHDSYRFAAAWGIRFAMIIWR
jgi:hypothetical protein